MKNFLKIIKPILNIWAYKSRFFSFLITFTIIFYMPLDSSENSLFIRFILPAIYAIFITSAGFYFFKLAERKNYFFLNSKLFTAIYILLVPFVSWKEIFLKPEADGSRVQALTNDSFNIIRFLTKYILGSISFVLLSSFIIFVALQPEISLIDWLQILAIIIAILAIIGSPFVFIANHKKIFHSKIISWLYVIFVPLASWIDIILSPSRKNLK